MQLRTTAIALFFLTTILLTGEGGSIMAKPLETIKGGIPPIDRNVIEKIETATFALG